MLCTWRVRPVMCLTADHSSFESTAPWILLSFLLFFLRNVWTRNNVSPSVAKSPWRRYVVVTANLRPPCLLPPGDANNLGDYCADVSGDRLLQGDQPPVTSGDGVWMTTTSGERPMANQLQAIISGGQRRPNAGDVSAVSPVTAPVNATGCWAVGVWRTAIRLLWWSV